MKSECSFHPYLAGVRFLLFLCARMTGSFHFSGFCSVFGLPHLYRGTTHYNISLVKRRKTKRKPNSQEEGAQEAVLSIGPSFSRPFYVKRVVKLWRPYERLHISYFLITFIVIVGGVD